MTREELVQSIANTENVLTLPMGDVRDAWNYGRLGIHVRRQISNDLKGMGIGHYPVNLPEYQHEYVRLYKLGTPISDIIDAVLHPSKEHDDQLRELIGGDSRAILDSIKALVCS